MANLRSDMYCVIQALRYDDTLIEAREYMDFTALSTCKSVIAIGVHTGVVLTFPVEHTEAGEDCVKNEKKLVLLFNTSVGWVSSEKIKGSNRFYISKLDCPLGVTETGKLLFLTLMVYPALQENFITAVAVRYRFTTQPKAVSVTTKYFLPCAVNILGCIAQVTTAQMLAARRMKVLSLDMTLAEFSHMLCMKFLRFDPAVFEEMPVGFLFESGSGAFIYDFGANCLSPNVGAAFACVKRGMTSVSLLPVGYFYLFVQDIILRSAASKTYHIRLGSELSRIDVIESEGINISVNLYDSADLLATDCEARNDPHYNLKSFDRK